MESDKDNSYTWGKKGKNEQLLDNLLLGKASRGFSFCFLWKYYKTEEDTNAQIVSLLVNFHKTVYQKELDKLKYT